MKRVVFVLFLFQSMFGLTERAYQNTIEAKKELVALLAQDTSKMELKYYVAWKEKVAQFLNQLASFVPDIKQKMESLIALKDSLFQASGAKENKSEKVTEAKQMSSQSLQQLSTLIEQLKKMPSEIESDVKQMSLEKGVLPELAFYYLDLAGAHDFWLSLAQLNTVSKEDEQRFTGAYEKAQGALYEAVAGVATAVLHFLAQEKNGFALQAEGVNKIVSKLVQGKITETFFDDATVARLGQMADHLVQLNALIMNGVWQTEDLLLAVLPSITKEKQSGIKMYLNMLVDSSLKNGISVGIFNTIISSWIVVLKKLEQYCSNLHDKKVIKVFISGLSQLGTYFAVLSETEQLLLLHASESSIAIGNPLNLSEGVSEIIRLFNAVNQLLVKTPLEQPVELLSPDKPLDLLGKKNIRTDDLILELRAIDTRFGKIVEAFSPEKDVFLTLNPLFDEIEKNQKAFDTIVSQTTVSEKDKSAYQKVLTATLGNCDLSTFSYMNKVLLFLQTDAGFKDVAVWLDGLLKPYLKKSKKMSEFRLDNNTLFQTYVKLITVLQTLFSEAVLLKSQNGLLKNMFKRGLVDNKTVGNYSLHLNNLFNSNKRADGTCKGLITGMILLIYDLLDESKRVMAELDELVVKSFQQQLRPLVQLLELLYEFENELIVSKVYTYVSLDNPYSDSEKLTEAKKLIDPNNASLFSLKVLPEQQKMTSSSGQQDGKKVYPLVSDDFIEGLLETLESIKKDITVKTATILLPNSVPRFNEQEKHLLEVDQLYKEAKKDFIKEDRMYYKNLFLTVADLLNSAKVTVAVATLEFVAKEKGLLYQQLAYAVTLFSALKNGKKAELQLTQSASFKTAFTQLGQLVQLLHEGISDLLQLDPTYFAVHTKEKDLLLLSIKKLFNDQKQQGKNVPLGLMHQLTALWDQFFKEVGVLFEKSSVESIKTFQEMMHPLLDYMIQLFECDNLFIDCAKRFGFSYPFLNDALLDAIEHMLDPLHAEQVGLQKSSTNDKKPSSTTNDSSGKTSDVPKNPTVEKQSLPLKTQTAIQKKLEELQALLLKMDIEKGIIPDLKTAVTEVHKLWTDYEVDSALQKVDANQEALLKKTYDEGLRSFGTMLVSLVKKSVEYLVSLKPEVERVYTVFETAYQKDKKIMKDSATNKELAAVLAVIKKFASVMEKTVLQVELLSDLSGIKEADFTALTVELEKLVNGTLVKGVAVGMVDILVGYAMDLVKKIIIHMKTVSETEVKAFQQNLLFLKEPFALCDKVFGKLCVLTKLKGLSLKNNQLTVQLSDYYAYITDQKKAAEFCKASADTQEIIIQRALTSLKGK